MAIIVEYQDNSKSIHVRKRAKDCGGFITTVRDFETGTVYNEKRFQSGKLLWSHHIDSVTGRFNGEQIVMKPDGSYVTRQFLQGFLQPI